jgi:hypothetical protein
MHGAKAPVRSMKQFVIQQKNGAELRLRPQRWTGEVASR